MVSPEAIGPPLGSPGAALNMVTDLAVLETLPAELIGALEIPDQAEKQLRTLEQHSSCFAVQQLAYGVLYADATCRITGTTSVALRRATAHQAVQLIAAMQNDGIELVRDVASWLNANAMTVLA